MTEHTNEELADVITMVDDEGNEILCEIVHEFDLAEFGKHYVVLTPVGSEEDESEEYPMDIFAVVQDESGEGGQLIPVEDDAEWTACEAVLEAYFESEQLYED